MPHVMLSYQWKSQAVMLQVKERLVNAGYKVWMDVDCMSMYFRKEFISHPFFVEFLLFISICCTLTFCVIVIYEISLSYNVNIKCKVRMYYNSVK